MDGGPWEFIMVHRPSSMVFNLRPGETTMRHNRAKEKLAAGTPVSVIAPTYTSAGLVELLAQIGFDVIFIDCEHGPAGWEDVENMVRAAELWGSTAIVRVQSNDPST